jgi:hypothetical protein
VAGVGAEEWLARGFGSGRRRWPRRLGEGGEEALRWAIKRLGEVYGCLRVLPEQLAGGKREWKQELGAAAAMAAVRLGVAREGAATGFYKRLGVSVDDSG